MVHSFWKLVQSGSVRKCAEWAENEVELEQIICPADPGHRRAGKRLTDLSVLLPAYSVDDIVWTWYSECLIQDHVLTQFRQHGLTGFEVRPVKVRWKKPSTRPLPTLWELVLTGWAGMAPPESGIHLIDHCPVCGLTEFSIWTDATKLIDERHWDGSDFFMVWPLPNYIWRSEISIAI